MGQVTATTEKTIGADADRTFQALSDYQGTRSSILTEHFSEYEVREGGQGDGTTVHWRLQATSKRVRDVLMRVTVPRERTLVERDANSSMVTTWTVTPAGENARVRVTTTWNGASGVGGFFERTFAPRGLQRIYDEQLTMLESELAD